jgi:hypothetical protein
MARRKTARMTDAAGQSRLYAALGKESSPNMPPGQTMLTYDAITGAHKRGENDRRIFVEVFRLYECARPRLVASLVGDLDPASSEPARPWRCGEKVRRHPSPLRRHPDRTPVPDARERRPLP